MTLQQQQHRQYRKCALHVLQHLWSMPTTTTSPRLCARRRSNHPFVPSFWGEPYWRRNKMSIDDDHRSYKNNRNHQQYYFSTSSTTPTASASAISDNDRNDNDNISGNNHQANHAFSAPASTYHRAFHPSHNENSSGDDDSDEINTNIDDDNDDPSHQQQVILSDLSPNKDQHHPNITTSNTSTATTSRVRPRATSQIEYERDDSYYNDYSDIMMDHFDEEEEEWEEGGLPPPPPLTMPPLQYGGPAIHTMGAVAAIANGTYATSSNDTTTTLSQSNQIKSSTTTPITNPPRRKYNIYDLDGAMINKINNIADIADIVTQVEDVPSLDGNDVEPLIIPLSRITSMKKYGEVGAQLTERLLLTCLGRMPMTVFDRYTKTATYVESTFSNKFSQVLDTKDWIPTATTTLDNGTTTSSETNAKTAPMRAPNLSNEGPIRIRSKLPYPTATLYNRAIIAWGNLENGAGLMRAESMFQLQIEEYVRELEFVRYHQLKNRQQEEQNRLNPASNTLPFQGLNPELQLPPEPFALPPGRKAYKSLLRAWAVSGDKNAAANTYELLREMEHLSGVQEILQMPRDTSLRPLPPIPPIDMPDLATYNVVLSAYAKANVLQHPIALERVKEIIRRIRDLRDATNNDEYCLDAYTYIALLQTYQKYIRSCKPPLEYWYLDEIYSTINDIHDEIERRKHFPVDVQERRMHLGKRSLDDNKVPDKRQKDLLIFFPMSMSWAYGVLVEALLKSAPLYRTIFIADDIVTAMTGRRNRINTPSTTNDSNNLNHVATAVPINIPYEICTDIWPQYETFMQVVEGWGRSGIPHAEERIEQLVQVVVAHAHYSRIYHLHDEMESWANSVWRFAPYIVENLLHRALEKSTHVRNKPTGQTFAISMKAWLKSNKPDAPYRAELLLQHIMHLYEVQEDSWYQPREVHLRYVLMHWLKFCSTGETYDGIGGKNLYPAEHCAKLVYGIRTRSWFQPMAEMIYGMAIRSWAMQKIPDMEKKDVVSIFDTEHDNSTKVKSLSKQRTLPQPNPVAQALQLLNSFAELQVSRGELLPPFPSNWVLTACGRVQPTMERKIEAYETAVQTFQRCKHNARTYELIVQVIRVQVEQLDDTHISLVEQLFRQCCVEGLLSQEMIMHVVSTAKQPETIQRLFGLSYQMAQLILQQREVHMSSYTIGTDKSGKLKNYARLPASLHISNLPKEWSANAVTVKTNQNRNSNAHTPNHNKAG